MHPVAALTQLGGVAGHQQLIRLTSRRRLQTAMAAGQVVCVARGRYALPTADEGRTAAARVSGAASHLSAAAYWEWQTLAPPELPQVCVPRGRKITADQRAGLELRWRTLSPLELTRGVTDPVTTVLDCARDLAFGEALAVADSALRDSTVTRDELDEAAAGLRPGRG